MKLLKLLIIQTRNVFPTNKCVNIYDMKYINIKYIFWSQNKTWNFLSLSQWNSLRENKEKRELFYCNESSMSSTFEFINTSKLQNKWKLLCRTNWRSKWEFKIAHSRMCIGYKAKKYRKTKNIEKKHSIHIKIVQTEKSL